MGLYLTPITSIRLLKFYIVNKVDYHDTNKNEENNKNVEDEDKDKEDYTGDFGGGIGEDEINNIKKVFNAGVGDVSLNKEINNIDKGVNTGGDCNFGNKRRRVEDINDVFGWRYQHWWRNKLCFWW